MYRTKTLQSNVIDTGTGTKQQQERGRELERKEIDGDKGEQKNLRCGFHRKEKKKRL